MKSLVSKEQGKLQNSFIYSFIYLFIHTYSSVDNKNVVTNNYTIWRDCTKCKDNISNMKRLFIKERKAYQHWGKEEAGAFIPFPTLHPSP